MKNVILAILAIAIYSSCQNGGGSMSSNYVAPVVAGHEIVVHKQGDGKRPNVGDYVFFNFESYDGQGKLWQSFKDAKTQPSIKIPSKEEEKKYVAFLEALKQVSEGDSLSMFVPADSMQGIPPEMKGQTIEYRVGITDIMDNEAYTAFMTQEATKKKALMAEAKLLSEKTVAASQDILKDYTAGKYQNVITTDSGLKVLILDEGRGENAAPGKTVSVDYVGMLKDGTKFDDSYSRGLGFDFNLGSGQVIKGWDEGLTYLNLGAKALLDIPYDLAYGERGSPPTIPAKSDLIFVIELNAIN